MAAANLKPKGPSGKAGPIIQVATFAHHAVTAELILASVQCGRVLALKRHCSRLSMLQKRIGVHQDMQDAPVGCDLSW